MKITTVCQALLNNLGPNLGYKGIIESWAKLSDNGLIGKYFCLQPYAFKFSYAVLGLPEPPKRPTPPFLAFIVSKEIKEKYGKKFQHLPRIDYLRNMGEIWKNLPSTEKQPYFDSFKDRLKAYKISNTQYISNLTEDQLNSIRKAKHTKALKRKSTKTKNLLKSLGKPMRPPTPFFLFAQEKFMTDRKTENPRTYMSKLSKDWYSSSPEMKQTYIDKYEKSLIEYKENLKKWELNMIEQGMSDVIYAKDGKKLPSKK